MRLFSGNWSKIKEKLETLGYYFERFPEKLRGRGIRDDEVINYIFRRGYDGIITEDKDFVETHRTDLEYRLINRGKIILLVERVPSTSTEYEVRIYEYSKSGKKEVLREHIP